MRLGLRLSLLAALGAAASVVGVVSIAEARSGSSPSSDGVSCGQAHHSHHSQEHLACMRALASASSEDRDTMELSDEPGNWFRSEATGTPLSVVDVGGRVDFVGGDLTETRHTATLLSKPVGSQVEVDQDDAKNGGIDSAEFDVPGVYVFICKVHPYMTGVVGVRNANGQIPPVTKQQLPFIGHLGADSLPATTVLSVLPAVAPTAADKQAKWDIRGVADELRPPTPGVGEVWVNTQFEAVPGQRDEHGVPKPGSITVAEADTFTVEREINGLDPDARGRWDNPHNMWSDVLENTIYNGHWFGRWQNRIDRATGDVLETVEVGHAPTHTVTNPNERSSQFETLTLPLSAEQNILKLVDESGLDIEDSDPTGNGLNHPHGQWLTANGKRMVVPNVFKGLGFAGSISVMDTETSDVLKELKAPSIAMPVATGIKKNSKAYVANIASGQVSVVNLGTMKLVKSIPVTLTPECKSGAQFGVLDTLQAPIQIPVSPDGRFVGVAVLSLTTVDRACTGSADHVAVIDTRTDQVVKYVGIARPGRSAGTHGANFGAKLGGGYYLHVANQFSNVLSTVDLDPNGDGNGTDAALVGRVLLGAGPDITDGTGGQGIKPLPNVYDGWIQDTVARRGELHPEVRGWIDALTRCQKKPSATGCIPAGPGR